MYSFVSYIILQRFLSYKGYTASKGGLNVIDKLGRIWKKAVLTVLWAYCLQNVLYSII